MDVVSGGSPGAIAIFKISVGLSGQYQMLVRYPPSDSATTGALYQVFLTDYLVEPLGSGFAGAPIFSTIVDQSDANSYADFMDNEGFVPLCLMDVNVAEDAAGATVVVTVSPSASDESATLLLADAVKLVKVD